MKTDTVEKKAPMLIPTWEDMEKNDELADKRKFVVRYKSLDPSIRRGVHGRFNTHKEAKEQCEKCMCYFNERVRVAVGNMSGFEREESRTLVTKIVAYAWVEEYLDGKLVHSEESECESVAKSLFVEGERPMQKNESARAAATAPRMVS